MFNFRPFAAALDCQIAIEITPEINKFPLSEFALPCGRAQRLELPAAMLGLL
jgi:hypothetical protein